jgi:hypothetical protein
MTTPGPSLAVSFDNPRLRRGTVFRYDTSARLEEVTTVPFIAIDGEEHAGRCGAETQAKSRRVLTTSRCTSG